MRIRLILTALWATCLFLFALNFIKNDYRWFILPFAVMALASVCLSTVAAIVNNASLSKAALRVHGFLCLPWIFGQQWKGGDDGPGLAWFLFVGIGCAVAAALSFAGRGAVPVTCAQCGAITPRAGYAAWQILVSICLFPLGLGALLLGRKATTCEHCGHSWHT